MPVQRLSIQRWRKGEAVALRLLSVGLLALFSWQLTGCASSRSSSPRPGHSERGLASWYGEAFHGRPTASGEIFDMYALSAAHRKLPLGTRVEVIHLGNGRRVEVTVNDRGPFVGRRILDLSYEAARRLGMVEEGVARVEIRVLARSSAASATRTYTVQVGAFREADRAAALAALLERQDLTARQVMRDGLMRVQVGSYRDRQAAEKVARKLRRQGYSAIIVRIP